MGRLFLCKNFSELEENCVFAPCTAWAAIRLLRANLFDIAGKKAAMIGRSAAVGRPLAHMLSCLDATVTLCHSRTKDLPGILRTSDIVVSATGQPKWIKGEMLSEGCVVLDVGINTDENDKLCGDVDFESVSQKVSMITPVPGGIGPVTLACIMENTLKAAEMKKTSS